MSKLPLFFWCSSLCLFTLCEGGSLRKDTPVSTTSQECNSMTQHVRASMRYTSPKGIGYNTGYTTLEGFFAPQNPLGDRWLPFLDVRGHLFDNGKWAANGGIGMRYLRDSRVWGVNAYYDYRNTTHQRYHQVGAGLESLGTVWDFRLNGYLPVGTTHSSFFKNRFYGFQGHYLFMQKARDYALKGFNGEVGAHVDYFKNAPLYFAAGPYYLTGIGTTTWGGEVRGAVDLFHRYIRLEGNVSYDHFFKWRGQGQISLSIPLGKKSCRPASPTLQQRTIQRVDRSEIIPVAREHVVHRAINPATGEPWFFWFVNNTSSSLGTFESPFPTLAQAQNASAPNQVIYVFPGDGSTQGMQDGIILQDSQLFLGASISHLLPTPQGPLTIPPLASNAPSITNTDGNVVTLAHNNTVSGFSINHSNGHGLSGIGISNVTADHLLMATGASDTNGIHLVNPAGYVVVSESSFTGNTNQISPNDGNGIFVNITTGNVLNSLNVSKCSFSDIRNNGFHDGGNGIFTLFQGGTIEQIHFSSNSFSELRTIACGIYVVVHGGFITDYNIINSAFTNIDTSSIGVLVTTSISTNTITNFNIAGCGFFNANNSTNAIQFDIGNGTVHNINIYNSSFNDILHFGSGIAISCDSIGSIENCNIFDNSFSHIDNNGIGVSIAASNPNNITHCSVLNNSFVGIGGSGNGFTYTGEPVDAINVSYNTFVGDNPLGTGYAALIGIFNGSTCVKFTHNTAHPTTTPAPYLFSGLVGTINRTTGSDSSTNIGEFSVVGNVNNAGSCSQ